MSDQFSISGPLDIYRFNHVEGHSLSFTGSGNNLFDNLLDMRLTLSNGFSDKRFKENLSTILNLNDERRVKFSFNIYNKLETLFSSATGTIQLQQQYIRFYIVMISEAITTRRDLILGLMQGFPVPSGFMQLIQIMLIIQLKPTQLSPFWEIHAGISATVIISAFQIP